MRDTTVKAWGKNEVTTEGGLDLESNFNKIDAAIQKLKENEIEVSLFIDPNNKSIELANMLEATWVELHTGSYANIFAMLYTNLKHTQHSIKELELSQDELINKLNKSLEDIKTASNFASNLGLKIAAGHGLNYQNVKNICNIKEISELNIGQSIVARSVFTGLHEAITEMKKIVNG